LCYVVIFERSGVDGNWLPLEARDDFLVGGWGEHGCHHDLGGHQRPVDVRALGVDGRIVVADQFVVMAAQPLTLGVHLPLATLKIIFALVK